MSDFFGREIERLKRKDSYRWLRAMEGAAAPRMQVDGREVIVLCSSNYLGLATHPRLKAAAIEATEELGVCSAASRLISGNNELYRTLEKRLAVFKGREAALVYSTGYMANLGVISAVVGEGDVIYTDALSHASIIDGCRLSRAAVEIFPHNDLDALEARLKSARERLADPGRAAGRRVPMSIGYWIAGAGRGADRSWPRRLRERDRHERDQPSRRGCAC